MDPVLFSFAIFKAENAASTGCSNWVKNKNEFFIIWDLFLTKFGVIFFAAPEFIIIAFSAFVLLRYINATAVEISYLSKWASIFSFFQRSIPILP